MRSRLLPYIASGLVLGLSSAGCAPTEPSPRSPEILGPSSVAVDAMEVDDVWVFAYRELPDAWMDAGYYGDAVVVEGCLQIGEAVVIWDPADLDVVEAVLSRIEAGETPGVGVGGGWWSLDEGADVDDFPAAAAVSARCATTDLWFAGREAPMVE